MSIGNSGLFVTNWLAILNATQLPVNLVGDTIKCALYTTSGVTPNYSTDTAYNASPYTAGEIPNGSGYTTGGNTLGSKTLTETPTGTIAFKADTSMGTQWASSTITGAGGALIYDTTGGAANKAILFVSFNGTFGTTAGTFTIVWPAGGIFTLDITP